MTIDEQIIFVAEWMGWTRNPKGFWFKPGKNISWNYDSCEVCPIPLTLDWLHECEMQLMRLGNKGHEYILHLWEITGLQKNNGFLLPLPNDVPEINLMIEKIWLLWVAASKEQRLAALVATLGGSI